METEGLNSKLNNYKDSGMIPMHMPGHKRNPDFIDPEFLRDITEIDGFDNFHRPDGIIKEISSMAAEVYKASKAFISVNGSTGLILSAILAVSAVNNSTSTRKAVVASNCHISVWHALELAGVTPVLITPKTSESLPFYGEVDLESVNKALKQNPDALFVILTSPTYEGIASNTKAIYEITNKYSVPLIVDEAHGAHFGLGDNFPEEATADLVIKSLHKTLNSPTSTAVMLSFGNKISEEMLTHYLSLTTTTSPSYLLMAGIDHSIRSLANDLSPVDSWYKRVCSLRENLTQSLRNIALFTHSEEEHYDCSKIIILTNNYMSGFELSETLRKDYKIELEAAFEDYIIAMTGIGDTDETLKAFEKAILEIDNSLDNCKKPSTKIHKIYSASEITLQRSFGEGIRQKTMAVKVESSVGKVAGEYLFAYPPGVPVVFPGQLLDAKTVEKLQELYASGATILTDPSRKYSGEIRVEVDI